MTNLELMICEAENSGEIDLDTRDIMLGILNESTAQARHAIQHSDRGKALIRDAQGYRTDSDNALKLGDKKKARELRKLADDYSDACDEEMRIADKIDPRAFADNAYRFGKVDLPGYRDMGRDVSKKNPWRGNSKREVRKPGYKDLDASQREKIKDIYDKINKSKMKKDKAQELKKEIDNMRLSPRKRKELNERIDNLSREHELNKEKRNDLLKNTRNTVKESVLEEIYEAELCGDITPEERAALIDYLND